jgi:hypothetical protein
VHEHCQSFELEFVLAKAYKQALVAHNSVIAIGQAHALDKGNKTI